MELAEVLANHRAQAQILRAHHQIALADAIEQVCDDVAEHGARFLEWIPEREAELMSTHQAAWFRHRFEMWRRQGLARVHPQRPRERQYLAVVVPRAADLERARADARRAAREASS